MRLAAEVGFVIHDERGSEVTDELERKTGVPPYLASPTERHYNLADAQVDSSGIDALLGRRSSGCRFRVARVPA